MKILYYDCFSGISGDMNLAAMIDLGVDPEYLRSELAKLGMADEFSLECRARNSNGIQGTQVHVRLHGLQHGHGNHPVEHHGDGHAHDAHGTADAPLAPAHAHPPHRNLADIASIISGSGLSEPVKRTSLNIFTRVAEAEAKVHGRPLEEVHFHEVGATDSIVDIVGAAICFHSLGVGAVWSSPLELGGGFAHCAHGVMPVPAPATVEILHGTPTTRGGVEHEATTPTGAAIVATLADAFTATPAMTTMKTGYGIGHRASRRPNMLRVHLAETEAPSEPAACAACLLECNIDDMSGEMLGDVMDVLLGAGAGDVYFTPVVMKKNRPGTVVSVMCGQDDRERFINMLFRHTTTLGIKIFPLEKAMLEQRMTTRETPLGQVRIKQAVMAGNILRSKPEFEDCRALARRHGMPLAEVYAIVGRCAGTAACNKPEWNNG